MESLSWQSSELGRGSRPDGLLAAPERVALRQRGATDADVTDLLRRWRGGDKDAFGRLLPCVYQELHRLARGAMRGERCDHTLQATALVHEAYLRLSRNAAPEWRNRGHFFAIFARTMRHILVDHARAAAAARRGGGAHVVRLSALADAGEGVAMLGGHPLDLLVFDEALTELSKLRPRQARVLELRAFCGLSVAEVADALDVSRQTVVLDTRLGRAWLVLRLQRGNA